MNNRTCPSCSQGILFEKTKKILFTYRGQKFLIHNVKVEVCDTCDDEVIEAKEIRRMEKITKEKSKDTNKIFIKPASIESTDDVDV